MEGKHEKKQIAKPKIIERYYWIRANSACFGIKSTDGYVSTCPPIAEWMIGKTIDEVIRYIKSRNAEIIELYDLKQ